MDKVAVIGLGPMGQRHIQACNNSGLVKFVGGMDMNHQRIGQLVSDGILSLEQGYTEYSKMVDELQPDIVVIATNGPSHYEIFHELVRMGVGKIFCEKPIAVSIEQAQNMIRTAQEHQVQLLINHGRRWCEDYETLKGRLEEGLIGKVESVYFTMGGGQLGCNGAHFVDLIQYLMSSNVSSLVGYIQEEGIVNPRGVQFMDPGGYAMMHLHNGTRVFFELAEDIGIPPLIVINGTFGRVTIIETQKQIIIERRSQENIGLPVTRYGTALSEREEIVIQHLDIISLALIGLEALAGNNVLVHPDAAISALETIVAIYASQAQDNGKVSLPLRESVWLNKVFSFT